MQIRGGRGGLGYPSCTLIKSQIQNGGGGSELLRAVNQQTFIRPPPEVFRKKKKKKPTQRWSHICEDIGTDGYQCTEYPDIARTVCDII